MPGCESLLFHGCAGSGSGGTAEVVELQEMMYDRESGCLVSEQTLFAVAAGSGRQARAWHTQLIYAPAEGGASTVSVCDLLSAGCRMRAACMLHSQPYTHSIACLQGYGLLPCTAAPCMHAIMMRAGTLRHGLPASNSALHALSWPSPLLANSRDVGGMTYMLITSPVPAGQGGGDGGCERHHHNRG
jgi:hypothetical protein